MQEDSDHIVAMSLTPRHFFTSWTIILSFPPSPVSPESGTEIGGPGASSSIVVSWFVVAIVERLEEEKI